MTSHDTSLYGKQKPRKLAGGKEISSSTTLSFTSQLSSLINGSTAPSSTNRTASSRHRPKKEDIFSTHNRNAAKRAKRDLEDDGAGTFEQKHSTSSETLDRGVWERSRRKMEEKARLYAAMKRGDVEDVDDKYGVDFDRKWAEREQKADEEHSDTDEDDDDSNDGPGPQEEMVEYVDDLGRTRLGTKSQALRAERIKQGRRDVEGDRFTARPTAPSQVIYGDTIQHRAFDPDEPIAVQMEELARKRDRSLTPPPEVHFDSSKEIRTKGTAFFQFSGDADERQRQMEYLEQERAETERKRSARDQVLDERKRKIEERRREVNARKGKRKADDFLEQLGVELGAKMVGAEHGGTAATDETKAVEAAIAREVEEEQPAID